MPSRALVLIAMVATLAGFAASGLEDPTQPPAAASSSSRSLASIASHSSRWPIMTTSRTRYSSYANWSCSSRVMPYFSATFSPVMPM